MLDDEDSHENICLRTILQKLKMQFENLDCCTETVRKAIIEKL